MEMNTWNQGESGQTVYISQWLCKRETFPETQACQHGGSAFSNPQLPRRKCVCSTRRRWHFCRRMIEFLSKLSPCSTHCHWELPLHRGPWHCNSLKSVYSKETRFLGRMKEILIFTWITVEKNVKTKDILFARKISNRIGNSFEISIFELSYTNKTWDFRFISTSSSLRKEHIISNI